jgi:hypothetical protein
MDKDQRKEYNKIYYANNKERIISDLCTKVECSFCGRSIIKNNLLKHEKSAICQRHRIRIIEINNFKKLKNTND